MVIIKENNGILNLIINRLKEEDELGLSEIYCELLKKDSEDSCHDLSEISEEELLDEFIKEKGCVG